MNFETIVCGHIEHIVDSLSPYSFTPLSPPHLIFARSLGGDRSNSPYALVRLIRDVHSLMRACASAFAIAQARAWTRGRHSKSHSENPRQRARNAVLNLITTLAIAMPQQRGHRAFGVAYVFRGGGSICRWNNARALFDNVVNANWPHWHLSAMCDCGLRTAQNGTMAGMSENVSQVRISLGHISPVAL